MKPHRVRLASGRFKGTWLPVPRGVRPTSARVREALLDSWQFRLPGAALLELFAGSGAVGLEALGRGAESLLAIDDDRRIVQTLERSFAELAPDSTEVGRARLPGGLEVAASGRRFDLIFADPPYDFDHVEGLLVAAGSVLAVDGELVLEHSKRRTAPEAIGGLERVGERRYGESCLALYRPRK